jgi:hypothetical protein
MRILELYLRVYLSVILDLDIYVRQSKSNPAPRMATSRGIDT